MGYRRLANGYIVCAVHKAGQTGVAYNTCETTKHWRNHGWKITHEDAVLPSEVKAFKLNHPDERWLWWVREPLDRLVSAWRFFTITSPEHMEATLGIDPYADFDKFCRAVCTAGQCDPHFTPQTDLVTHNKRLFVPTDIMRFDELTPWWEYINGIKWDHTADNASTRPLEEGDTNLHPVTLAHIHRTYKKDFEHYDQATLYANRSSDIQRHCGKVQDGIAFLRVSD